MIFIFHLYFIYISKWTNCDYVLNVICPQNVLHDCLCIPVFYSQNFWWHFHAMFNLSLKLGNRFVCGLLAKTWNFTNPHKKKSHGKKSNRTILVANWGRCFRRWFLFAKLSSSFSFSKTKLTNCRRLESSIVLSSYVNWILYAWKCRSFIRICWREALVQLWTMSNRCSPIISDTFVHCGDVLHCPNGSNTYLRSLINNWPGFFKFFFQSYNCRPIWCTLSAENCTYFASCLRITFTVFVIRFHNVIMQMSKLQHCQP